MDKAMLRQALRSTRRKLDPGLRQQYNHAINQHCIAWINSKNVQHIAVYLAQDGEVDLTELISWLWQKSKTCYLPKLHQDTLLHFAHYTHAIKLQANRYGILEPTTEGLVASELELVIAPLVGYDATGNRLGMGGGFYDSTLASPSRRPQLIGCAYSLQRCAALPSDPWDIPLDALINECGMIHF